MGDEFGILVSIRAKTYQYSLQTGHIRTPMLGYTNVSDEGILYSISNNMYA